jgi:hypothetical protein
MQDDGPNIREHEMDDCHFGSAQERGQTTQVRLLEKGIKVSTQSV